MNFCSEDIVVIIFDADPYLMSLVHLNKEADIASSPDPTKLFNVARRQN